jgi:hypothetical protein
VLDRYRRYRRYRCHKTSCIAATRDHCDMANVVRGCERSAFIAGTLACARAGREQKKGEYRSIAVWIGA